MKRTRTSFLVLLASAVASIALAAPGLADRIVLTDGRDIEGTVLREDDKTLTVEERGVGISLTTTIRKSQVKTWDKPSREGQPYVVIPVRGVIGEDVTAEALRAGLAEARLAKPRYVVLEIDSPGGNIGAMMDMLDVLNKASGDFKIVAYVERAHSAAAVIAMSCPQVYMKPDATIGATVPFRMTETGPVDVDAKLRSVIEAQMRMANQRGGHADLLIRGMSEIDLELYLTVDKGKPKLRASGPGKLVKGKGQILTLTTDEAVACGFAQGAATMSELGKLVCGGAWHEVSRVAYDTTIATAAMQKQEERDAAEKRQRLIARQKAFEDIKPQLDEIARRAAELAAKAAANDSEIKRLVTNFNESGARTASARRAVEAQVTQLRSESEAAKNELALLAERHRRLLATLPEE